MKQLKITISVILAALLVFSVFTACKGNKKTDGENSVTVTVTDENGEAVTDENGEPVTELVNPDDTTADSKGGEVVIEGGESTTDNVAASETSKASKEDENKKDKKGNETTKKETITKPAKPDKPSDFKATDVTKDSLTLSWGAVKCDGYELEYKENGKDWKSLQKSMTSTKAKLQEYLNPYTLYSFRVRAYNKNSAGKNASKWAEISVKTKADDSYNRFLTVKVKLPFDSKKKDTLRIYVKKQGKDEKYVLVSEKEVICDKSNVKITTEKKYKGVVSVKAVLVDHKKEAKTETNDDSCTLDLTAIGIDVEVDNDEI